MKELSCSCSQCQLGDGTLAVFVPLFVLLEELGIKSAKGLATFEKFLMNFQ
jgi:hypothetical protein